MFPADRPTVKLFSTDIAGKGTWPNWLLKLDLLLLWTARFSPIVRHLSLWSWWRRGWTRLLYPEDLAVVKGEDSPRGQLEVRRKTDGLVLVHHDVLLVGHQVHQHVLLGLLHDGGRGESAGH